MPRTFACDGGTGIVGRLDSGSYEATIPGSYLGRRRDSKVLLVGPMTRVRWGAARSGLTLPVAVAAVKRKFEAARVQTGSAERIWRE
jgi:hypothetical protein